ncbi:M1 family metallopeptidase [bacterium]|nr:M1 family metallopeptidase [bacterium]
MRRLVLLLLLVLPLNTYAALEGTAWARVKREWPIRSQYDISLEVDTKNRSYKGRQKVVFTNRQKRSTNYVVFFVYPNDPGLTKSQKQYMTISNTVVNQEAAQIEEKGPYLRIPLGKELLQGHSVIIEFDFRSTVPEQKQSTDLFSQALDELKRMMDPKSQSETDYGVFSSGKDIINLGLWYPILAKYDKEGWDEEKYAGIGDVSYFDPADFKVAITVPAEYRVVTTGVEINRTPASNGNLTHTIDSPMSRDFEVELSRAFSEATQLKNKTTIRSFFLQQHSKSGLSVLESAAKAFEYFEQSFGRYPYTELDIVEAPLYGGAGGVEFPGLVTISSMLYQEDQQEVNDDVLKNLLAGNPVFGQLLEFVVVHEVAHQWWNAVVGSNSKKHPFIDEAMANYSAILYFEHYYGRKAAEQQMAMQMKVNYQMHRLLGGQDKPVLLPASSFQGPLEYAAIIYGKGALFFDHLRSLMGNAAFLSAARSYYQTYWFGIAGPDDFKKIAQKKSPAKGKAIEDLFQRWMNGVYGDEDIGPGTLDGVIKTVLSTNQDIPTERLDDLLKELDQILKQ